MTGLDRNQTPKTRPMPQKRTALVASLDIGTRALAWGLYISAMFRNQLAAYQMGTLTSFLPAFLLSGFIYPLANMPWIIRVISVIIPARYFIDMTKGIFLKGTGLQLLWFDLLLLIVYAVGISFLAVRKLRQKIA